MRPRGTRTFSPFSVDSTLHTSINESSWFVVGTMFAEQGGSSVLTSFLRDSVQLSSSILSFSPLSSSCLCFFYIMSSQQPIGTDFQLVSVCTTKCFYPLASGDASFSFESILFKTDMIPPWCSLKEILHSFAKLVVLFSIPECVCCICTRLSVSWHTLQLGLPSIWTILCVVTNSSLELAFLLSVSFFVKCPICSDSLPKLCLVMLNVCPREDVKHRSQPVWEHWRPVQMCWKGSLLAVGPGWKKKGGSCGENVCSGKVVALGSRSTTRPLCLTTWHSGSNHRDVRSFTE